MYLCCQAAGFFQALSVTVIVVCRESPFTANNNAGGGFGEPEAEQMHQYITRKRQQVA